MISVLMLLLLLLFTQVSEKYRVSNPSSEDEIDYDCYIRPEKASDYIIEADQFEVEEEYSVDKQETVQWLLITGRFVVGWAWANFISLSVSKLLAAIVSDSYRSAVWVNILEKVTLSVFVFILGALI
jgi:hypothetical protein